MNNSISKVDDVRKRYKKTYQKNYYINRRDYILSLVNMNSEKLSPQEKIDLDKYINKYRPSTAKMMRECAFIPRGDKGEKIFKIEHRTVTVRFD